MQILQHYDWCALLQLQGLLAGEAVVFDLVVEGGRPQARNVPQWHMVVPAAVAAIPYADSMLPGRSFH